MSTINQALGSTQMRAVEASGLLAERRGISGKRLLSIFALSISFANTPQAKAESHSYSLIYNGQSTNIIYQGRQIAVEVSPYALYKKFTGTGSTKSFHKVIILGASGGQGCTSFVTADGGLSFTDSACVVMSTKGSAALIKITHNFVYPRGRVSDDTESPTRNSQLYYDVKFSASGCRVTASGFEVQVLGKKKRIPAGRALCRLS